MTLVVGLVDSGLAPEQPRVAAASFLHRGDEVARLDDGAPDRLGHGRALAAILGGVPGVSLCAARVFDVRLVCTPAQAAAALDWCVARGARLVNLSLGLREERPVLRDACDRALAAGVVLVAAAPARGAPTFPAFHPGVIRATGDARCAPDEISFLDSVYADFGGAVRTERGDVAGASVGSAHVARAVAALLVAGFSPEAARAELARTARHRGVERRSS